MKTSSQGLAFIKDQEGCVLHVYRDQVGKRTIGVGHLITADDPDYSDGITLLEALDILARDVQRFEQAVNAYALDLTQNQFDVLVDFSFNCGEGALKQLLGHGLEQVPEQLPKWCHGGAQVIGALVKRRAAEVRLWEAA